MFVLGMLAMYFLLNLIVVVSLLIRERDMLKEKQRYLRVIRQILIYLLFGTILAIMESLQ